MRVASVGDQLVLRSGRRVRITVPADPARPWGAVHLGRHWVVLREARRRGNQLGVEHYFGGTRGPLQLSAVDAGELARLLNRVRPAADGDG